MPTRLPTGFEVAASREAFFESADVLTLHLPLNADTRGIVKAEDLARMKPTALFVNTSRSGLVGDAVLAAALAKGRPGRAAVRCGAAKRSATPLRRPRWPAGAALPAGP